MDVDEEISDFGKINQQENNNDKVESSLGTEVEEVADYEKILHQIVNEVEKNLAAKMDVDEELSNFGKINMQENTNDKVENSLGTKVEDVTDKEKILHQIVNKIEKNLAAKKDVDEGISDIDKINQQQNTDKVESNLGTEVENVTDYEKIWHQIPNEVEKNLVAKMDVDEEITDFGKINQQENTDDKVESSLGTEVEEVTHCEKILHQIIIDIDTTLAAKMDVDEVISDFGKINQQENTHDKVESSFSTKVEEVTDHENICHRITNESEKNLAAKMDVDEEQNTDKVESSLGTKVEEVTHFEKIQITNEIEKNLAAKMDVDEEVSDMDKINHPQNDGKIQFSFGNEMEQVTDGDDKTYKFKLPKFQVSIFIRTFFISH
jgi:hypothetical protein